MKSHKEFMDKLIELAHEPTLPEKTIAEKTHDALNVGGEKDERKD